MNSKRYVWLDYARFWGIFLVVLGHTTIPRGAVDFIYLFHMPLFFIISGYLFRSGKYDSYGQFVKEKSAQLLIPYLFFSVLTGLFWFFVGRKFGDDAGMVVGWRDCLLSFTATRPVFFNQVLWFLPALFVTENLYYWAVRYLRPAYVLVFFLAMAWMYNFFVGIDLPLHANLAIGYVVFFAFGAIIRPLWDKIVVHTQTVAINFVILIACLALEWLMFLISFYTNIGMRSPNAFILTVLAGILGSVAVFNLGVLGQKFGGASRIVTFYATYTMVLYTLHGQIMSVLKGVALFVLDIPVSVYADAVWSNLALVTGAFAVAWPVTLLFRKYAPYLIGK